MAYGGGDPKYWRALLKGGTPQKRWRKRGRADDASSDDAQELAEINKRWRRRYGYRQDDHILVRTFFATMLWLVVLISGGFLLLVVVGTIAHLFGF